MRKILFVLLTLFAITSCSETVCDIIPSDGQYIGRIGYNDGNDDYGSTFSLVISDGKCVDFVMYDGAEQFDYYKPANISTKGSYPKFEYFINDFMVQARFSDIENFTAHLSGMLCNTYDETGFGAVGTIMVNLDAYPVHFALDNTDLDADGNGVLDSRQ